MKIKDLKNIDRAIAIESKEEAEEFASDPEKFLRKYGALKDHEDFNGIKFDMDELLKTDFSKEKAWRCHDGSCFWTWCDIA